VLQNVNKTSLRRETQTTTVIKMCQRNTWESKARVSRGLWNMRIQLQRAQSDSSGCCKNSCVQEGMGFVCQQKTRAHVGGIFWLADNTAVCIFLLFFNCKCNTQNNVHDPWLLWLAQKKHGGANMIIERLVTKIPHSVFRTETRLRTRHALV